MSIGCDCDCIDEHPYSTSKHCAECSVDCSRTYAIRLIAYLSDAGKDVNMTCNDGSCVVTWTIELTDVLGYKDLPSIS
ncbi:MAG: hypothetical protein M0R51_10395 [Clostridia bacterium]|jgi:hypothetical protein|nr:hypothetical protein [Clostridia bacterium]